MVLDVPIKTKLTSKYWYQTLNSIYFLITKIEFQIVSLLHAVWLSKIVNIELKFIVEFKKKKNFHNLQIKKKKAFQCSFCTSFRLIKVLLISCDDSYCVVVDSVFEFCISSSLCKFKMSVVDIKLPNILQTENEDRVQH